MRALAIAIAVLFIACGGSKNPNSVGQSQPLALYNADGYGCAVEQSDASSLHLENNELTSVVELHFAEDVCSNNGGQYFLARASSRLFWLGGSGCRTVEQPATGTHGVMVYRSTAGLFSLPGNACVSFPGEDGRDYRTASIPRALAVFETKVEAEQFAARLTAQ